MSFSLGFLVVLSYVMFFAVSLTVADAGYKNTVIDSNIPLMLLFSSFSTRKLVN